jgi:hypothetical protein
MTKYTFRTIVAPDAVRAEFTGLRDQLNSSDKELMQAFWNIGIDRLDDIKREVEMLQAQAAEARAEKKEVRAAAKLKERAAKKAPEKEEEFVDDGDEDIECIVVDATR